MRGPWGTTIIHDVTAPHFFSRPNISDYESENLNCEAHSPGRSTGFSRDDPFERSRAATVVPRSMICQITYLKSQEKFVCRQTNNHKCETDINSTILFVPNYPPSRQGNFSDYSGHAGHARELVRKSAHFPPILRQIRPNPAENLSSTSQKKILIWAVTVLKSQILFISMQALGSRTVPAIRSASRDDRLEHWRPAMPATRKLVPGGFIGRADCPV